MSTLYFTLTLEFNFILNILYYVNSPAVKLGIGVTRDTGTNVNKSWNFQDDKDVCKMETRSAKAG